MSRFTSGQATVIRLVMVIAFMVAGAVPAFAQGPGKLEFTIVPAGWVSVTEPDTQPEPAFSQYFLGGTFTVNWTRIGLEGELFFAPGRSQDLKFGSQSRTLKTPGVTIDSVTLVFPLMGNRGRIVPYIDGGIGEFTIMRTSDNVTQPDTETFRAGNFGGGVKWHSSGRIGIRGDYRFQVIRSEFASPGSFFGEELRKVHRFYGALTINLIPLP